MSNYSFLAEAEAEYLEAIRFYEGQMAGLGDALIHPTFIYKILFCLIYPKS
jgi:hypothetical protein